MCPINVYDYIKQNNMPTIRLRIKFSVAYKEGKLNNHTLDKALIINGFSYWKDASVSFKKHDSSKCYRESVDIVLTLKKGKIIFITHSYLET